MKHTAEPWAVCKESDDCYAIVQDIEKDGVLVGSDVVLSAISADIDERSGIPLLADADRIVACVNACAGIPDDMVQHVVSFGMSGHSKALENAEERREYWGDRWAKEFDMRMAAEKQRDELLAALEKFSAWNKRYPSTRIYSATAIRGIANELDQIAAEADSAIASAQSSQSVVKDSLTTENHIEQPIEKVESGATIKLGEICSRLGFTITAEFLASLGYRPVATDKNAKLYAESQWRGICSALVQHISNVAVGMKKAA